MAENRVGRMFKTGLIVTESVAASGCPAESTALTVMSASGTDKRFTSMPDVSSPLRTFTRRASFNVAPGPLLSRRGHTP
jgi:hypothetical protein